MSNELYLGIPYKVWEECCANAEEMLYEEDIGQHIVGIYPAAPRIYGDESAPTSLLCLYIDSPESLINPLHKSKDGIYMINGSYTTQVEYINLFNWIKSLKDQIRINHLIPCFENSFYQDENIDKIIACVQEYCSKVNFNYNYNIALEERALKIFYQLGKYMPSINPEYGEVCNLRELYKLGLMGNHIKRDIDISFLEKQLSNAAVEYFKWII